MEEADKKEQVEKTMASMAGLAQEAQEASKAKASAESKIKKTEEALDQLEKEISVAGDAQKTELENKKKIAVEAAEEAKRSLTAAELSMDKTKVALEKAASDPEIKAARVEESELKSGEATKAKAEVDMGLKMAEESLKSDGQRLSEMKKEGVATSEEMEEMEEEVESARREASQAKRDQERLTRESEKADKELAEVKDQVETGSVEQLVESVVKDSSVASTQGVGVLPSDEEKSRMVENVKKSTKLDEETKEATVNAIQNAQDSAQTDTILNAASEGSDAVREAAASATKSSTVFTMSDVLGKYMMDHPGYPGRKDWEIFSVRVVGGEGLMSSKTAHSACSSFPDAALVTKDIAHAGRLAGFQRCQPGWIERYGMDVPEEDGKCRSLPNGEGKCPKGTEEEKSSSSEGSSSIECVRECPDATAVVMAGDAGCSTNQSPPCEEGQRESNGNCMTEPGTVASSTTAMAQALCTRPLQEEEAGKKSFFGGRALDGRIFCSQS